MSLTHAGSATISQQHSTSSGKLFGQSPSVAWLQQQFASVISVQGGIGVGAGVSSISGGVGIRTVKNK